MSKKTLYFITFVTLFSFQSVSALQPQEIFRYFNGPTVQAITSTTAKLSLSQGVLQGLTEEEKSGIYFEYGETQQMCIMIYPTPEYCLPKKTEVGKTDVTINNLKPGTSYTVTYKRDNTIRCITMPCAGNEFQSLSVEFTTSAQSGATPSVDNVQIRKNLFIGSRGAQVVTLQTILNKQGYMQVSPTGYFGLITYKAVQQFQKAHGISQTGFVGPLTRAVLIKMTATPSPHSTAETFEGTITAYSTACFADGECSITVDGKKVITTIGWSQQIVGKVLGIPDFGSIEQKVGSRAKVYAKKVSDGYTLYGSESYYVQVQ